MSMFIEKFHQETKNRFEYIKLSAVNVFLRKKEIELVLLYPDSISALMDADREAIASAAKKVLNSNAAVTVKLVKSHFDPAFFKKDLLAFFKAYPSVASTVSEEDIEAIAAEKNKRVSVYLEPFIYGYCVQSRLAAEVESFLKRNYCDPVDFAFLKKEQSQAEPEESADEEPVSSMELEMPGGRYIIPENIDALVGKPVYERACYIADAVLPKESLTVCGTLVNFSEFGYRGKDGEDKMFYRLTVEDFTGRLECLYFPTKASKDKIGLLKQGKQIAVRGSLEPDKKNEGALIYVIKDISYCTLPESFTENRLKRKVDAVYRVVSPRPYEAAEQVSLFGHDSGAAGELPRLAGKTYVVFDLETTGFNPLTDQIIEVGAVKIENGRFTEVFSSFVDPRVPIPENITKLTGITDRDVAGKPLIEDVLVDFYKFCDGAAIVAQNLPFDLGFVTAKGKPLGIYFDHEKYDTLYMARKTFPGLSSYKLGNMCSEFGIELKDAHRALDDAAATAKLLMKIFEKDGRNA